MKKSLIIIVVVMIYFFPKESMAASPDFDKNGKTDMSDAILGLQVIAGLRSGVNVQLSDVISVLRVSAGIATQSVQNTEYEGHWKSEQMVMVYGGSINQGYLDINVTADGSFSGITGAYLCLPYCPMNFCSCFHMEATDVQVSGTIDFLKSTGTIRVEGITDGKSFKIINDSTNAIRFILDNAILDVVKIFELDKVI